MPRGVYIRTKEAKENIRLAHIGKINELSGNWKGNKVGYNALHGWVRRKLGRPKLCEQCGFTSNNTYQFHWANISGNYLRDLSDWIRLCASCHRLYDLGKLTLKSR